jgi:hypothetical protein
MTINLRNLTLMTALSSGLLLGAYGQETPSNSNASGNSTDTGNTEVIQAGTTSGTQNSAENETSDVTESDWVVDHEASTLGFTFTSYGNEQTGVFKSWKAVIKSGPDDLENAYAEVTVDLNSIDTNESERDLTAQGSAYLNARQHPQAVFKTSAFRSTGDGAYEAEPFTLVENGNSVHMTGSVPFERESYGIGESGDYEEAGKVIVVNVDLHATRK